MHVFGETSDTWFQGGNSESVIAMAWLLASRQMGKVVILADETSLVSFVLHLDGRGGVALRLQTM
jgi:hypothetical protein